MVTVTVHKTSDGDFKSIISRGHADYAEYDQDIVCSAISVLEITIANAIEVLTCDSENVNISIDEEDGGFALQVLRPLSDQAKILLDTLVLGLTDISESYPENITIEIREV